MPDHVPYRTQPDAAFADRLEALLVDRLTRGTLAVPLDDDRVDDRDRGRVDERDRGRVDERDDDRAAELPFDVVVPLGREDPTDGWRRSIELEPAGMSPTRAAGWRVALMVAVGVAAATVLVALALLERVGDDPAPADVPTPLPSGLPTTSAPSEPTDPFEGAWWSTDLDGSSQSLTIVRSGDEYEVVLHDDAADPCSESPSTESGTGRLDASGELVVPVVLRCDEASTPAEGAPVLTFSHRPRTDELVDGIGVRWVPQDAMWPQSSIAEVLAAQERADAGDPTATWQLDPRLLTDEWWEHLGAGSSQVIERFLREEVGWDHALFNPYRGDDGDGAADGIIRGVVFLRCGPDANNPLYPFAADHQEASGAEGCAPTIDDLRYEAVSLDLAQPGRRGADGIWVVSRWAITTPFAQTDPALAEERAMNLLEGFLDARLAGGDAAGLVRADGAFRESDDVPLLYATSTGAPYERYEIEQVGGPWWPYGEMEFVVRMFTDGDATVVEQPIAWRDVGGARLALVHDARTTTENGRPVPVRYAFFGGEVTASAADPWHANPFFAVALSLDDRRDDERVELIADPRPITTDCGTGPAPTDTGDLARKLRTRPDLVVEGPWPATVGGVEGLVMEVSVAAEARTCGRASSTPVLTNDGRGLRLDVGSRLRLHLIDVPDGATTRLVAVAVVAPDGRFQDVLQAATPIVDSIELHVP